MTHLALLLALTAAPLPTAQDAGADARPLVAVLYFDVPEKAEELLVFRKGMAQLLITDLVQSGRLRVVERARIQEVFDELGLQHSGKVDARQAERLGKLLPTRYQVDGSLLPLGKELFFEVRVRRVESGEIVKGFRVRASPDDVYEAEQKIAAQVIALIVARDSLEPPAKPSSTGVKLKYSTAVKYAQALDAVDRKDKPAAVAKLKEIVKEEPGLVMAQLDLESLMR